MDNYYFHMDNLSVGYDKKALIHDICIGIKGGDCNSHWSKWFW